MMCNKKNKCEKCHFYQDWYTTDKASGETTRTMQCIFISQTILMSDVIQGLKGNQAATESFRNEMVKGQSDFVAMLSYQGNGEERKKLK